MTEPLPVLLLVDDEARILSALRRTLRRERFEILTSESATEALRLLEARRVDAILCDHKMPGASGLDLLATVAERHPDVRRLLITGWPEAVPRDLMTRLGIRALIPKPWDDGELKAILRKELSGS